MLGLAHSAVLAVAGVVAGAVGTAGGITSLVSYPALLAVGIPPLRANIANLVAAVGCWPGSALASRPELEGRGGWLARWAPVVALGSAIGSALLLTTSPGLFERVVPFLVLAGAVALIAQPRLSALRRQPRRHGRPGALAGGLLGISVYNGYFGAGAGVMTLALLMLLADDDLRRANALKNVLLGGAALVSTTAFVLFGRVSWGAAVPLGLGMFAGSLLGPRAARRLPEGLLRVMVALFGIALAARLWTDPSL